MLRNTKKHLYFAKQLGKEQSRSKVSNIPTLSRLCFAYFFLQFSFERIKFFHFAGVPVRCGSQFMFYLDTSGRYDFGKYIQRCLPIATVQCVCFILLKNRIVFCKLIVSKPTQFLYKIPYLKHLSYTKKDLCRPHV